MVARSIDLRERFLRLLEIEFAKAFFISLNFGKARSRLLHLCIYIYIYMYIIRDLSTRTKRTSIPVVEYFRLTHSSSVLALFAFRRCIRHLPLSRHGNGSKYPLRAGLVEMYLYA